MPGGKANITGVEGNTFSSTNQPKSRRRSTKFLTRLLTKELKGKHDIIISGFDPQTGEPAKLRVPMPTREDIVRALLRQAAKGNIYAIKEIFDRIEGKTMQALELSGSIDYNKLSNDQLEYIVNRLKENNEQRTKYKIS